MGISILAWLSSLDPYSWANMGRGMITMPMWKCLFINLYLYNYIQYHYMVKPRILLFKSLVKRNCTQNITYFRHLEKRHLYWPETKSRTILSRAIWASIWKWSCSNPITGYFPGVWTYGQFTSGHIGHTKMPLFELSM
jgi:hypothetical protein